MEQESHVLRKRLEIDIENLTSCSQHKVISIGERR